MESVEKLRDLAADINGNEIIDHMQLYPSCVFDGAWLNSWHHAFDRELEALEREIAERYMELPLDADGVPCKPGDKLADKDGIPFFIKSVSSFRVYDEDGSWVDPSFCGHVKSDPVKELLEEFGDWYKHVAGGCDESSVIDEYAAKIREIINIE